MRFTIFSLQTFFPLEFREGKNESAPLSLFGWSLFSTPTEHSFYMVYVVIY